MNPDQDECDCEMQVVDRPTMEVISEGQKGPLGFDLRSKKQRAADERKRKRNAKKKRSSR